MVLKRQALFQRFQKKLNQELHMQASSATLLSAFAVGIIVKNRNDLADRLMRLGIECRPLICGNIGRQPFWVKRYGKVSLPMADVIHKNGLYFPCNPYLNNRKLFVLQT